MNYKLLALGGDGIGPEVLDSGLSILEAISIVEDLSNIQIKRHIFNKNRVGDHIWYISSMRKFKRHFPNWNQKYSTKILKEIPVVVIA